MNNIKTAIQNLQPEELYLLLTEYQKSYIHREVEIEWAIEDIEQFFCDHVTNKTVSNEAKKHKMTKDNYLRKVAQYYLSIASDSEEDHDYYDLEEAINNF